MSLSQIELLIENIANNALLLAAKSFDARIDAIDFLEFHILGQIDALRKIEPDKDRLKELYNEAEKVKAQLEEIDNQLFRRLEQETKQERYNGKRFEELVREYVSPRNNKPLDQEGYDNLDIFINRLLALQDIPEQSKPLQPEMVFYQKTPARVVFEMIKTAGFKKDDVFFDIGSGWGQVVMLVNLLVGNGSAGVEFDPAFCKYSEECAAMLGLQDVAFINCDAREADYSSGTIFFMYTPFRGKMLQEVLEILRKESLKREIRIITYGPCTMEVAALEWLYGTCETGLGVNSLAFFRSLPGP